mgnify:CR=1 FL=1
MLETISEIDNLIEVVNKEGSIFGPTDKDLEVLRSFRDYCEKRGELSPGQTDWLIRLSEKYERSSIEEEQTWLAGYDKYRLDIERMAQYYKANPPYFANLVSAVKEGKKLSKHAYNKLCKNKYSMKVLAQYKEPPKYNKSQLVLFRANNKVAKIHQETELAARLARRITNHANKKEVAGFIVDNDFHYITRAAKGSRKYKILVVGHTVPIIAHESDIKRAKVKR